MLLQAEGPMWAEDWLVEAFAPLHDWPWVALYPRHSLCLHYERCKDRVVIHHHSTAPAEALDDLNTLFLGCVRVDKLILLPEEWLKAFTISL